MQATTVLALEFADGSVGRMQYYATDTSDEAIQATVDKALFAEGRPLRWFRTTLGSFPAADFRNAWVTQGNRVVHDMPKARDILRDRLRAERVPLLAALDVEYQRADETADATAKGLAIAEKQALRDAPANPAIDLAMTVDELKSLTLDALTVTPIAVVADAKPLA